MALHTAALALLAIALSLFVCRRLLALPLLGTATYVTATFVSSFLLVATGAKLFRIDFSSPQFFASLPIMAAFVEGFLAINRRRKSGASPSFQAGCFPPNRHGRPADPSRMCFCRVSQLARSTLAS